mgnify:CR=1 FL=1
MVLSGIISRPAPGAAGEFIGVALANVFEEGDGRGLHVAQLELSGGDAGIDVGDRDNSALLEVLLQVLLVAVIAGQQGQVPDHQAGGPNLCGLFIFAVGAGVADMGIGEGDNLARIGRVGQNFLIAGHGGVENHLTDRHPLSAYCQAFENTSVFKRKNGRTGQANLQLSAE